MTTDTVRAGAAFVQLYANDRGFRGVLDAAVRRFQAWDEGMTRALEAARERVQAFAPRVPPAPTIELGEVITACPTLPPPDFAFGTDLSRGLDAIPLPHPSADILIPGTEG